MKKLGFIMLTALTLLVSACGGSGDDPASTSQAGQTTAATASSTAPSTTLLATTTTTNWVRCASEYGTCTVPATTQVRYGLDGKYATKTVTGSIACNNATFGDPYPGANKVCDYAATSTTPTTSTDTGSGTTWTYCADENGSCKFSGTRQVRYGLDGKYATMTATDSIACSNAVFGDPYPGVKKKCDYAGTTSGTSTPTSTTSPTSSTTPTTTNWVRCASEYGTCTVPATTQVRYGASGKYAFKTVTGSIGCNNTVFGDPYPGVAKVCDYSASTGTNTTTTPTTSTPSTTQIVDYYGDSTIWGYASGSGARVANPAPAVFASAMKGLPVTYTVRNEGVNSTDACQLLKGNDGVHPAWTTQMANSNATYVILNHGINDEWRYDLATYKSCLHSLAQIARNNKKKVIFETPNPTQNSGPNAQDVWVAAMREVATQEQIPVIDQYQYLTNYLAGKSPYTICPDGLHPTDEVYAMKGNYAASVFKKLFPAS